jgi:hypothetical protein
MSIAEGDGGVEQRGVETPGRDGGTTCDGVGSEMLYAEPLFYEFSMRFIVEK